MSKKEDATLARVNAEIDECAALLETLRARYEQYFLGMERIPPERERKDVFRRVQQLERLSLNNTATKFRLQSLAQKFRTYGEYWSRTLRQIEDGTYVRHVAKARKLVAQQDAADLAAAQQAAAAQRAASPTSPASPTPPTAAARSFLDEIGDLADDFLSSLDQTFKAPTKALAPTVAATLAPPKPPPVPPPKLPPSALKPAPVPVPVPVPAPSDEARSLYAQFTQARAQTSGGKPAGAVPAFDDFKRSLDRQTEQLRQGNPTRRVRFRVVVQDGRTLIQPVVET